MAILLPEISKYEKIFDENDTSEKCIFISRKIWKELIYLFYLCITMNVKTKIGIMLKNNNRFLWSKNNDRNECNCHTIITFGSLFKFRVKHNFQLDSDKPVFEIAIRQAIIDIDINMNFYNMHPLHDDNRILYNRIDYSD